MNTITIKKEDADYWESLLREKSLNLKDRGLQEDTILAKWSVHLGWGVTAWLKVYSGATALTACMEWNRGGTFIIKSTPVRRTLLGEWPSPDGNTEDDVMVVIEGEDEKKETAPESADNPLLTFEEGKRLAESGEAKPDYAGDILFDVSATDNRSQRSLNEPVETSGQMGLLHGGPVRLGLRRGFR